MAQALEMGMRQNEDVWDSDVGSNVLRGRVPANAL